MELFARSLALFVALAGLFFAGLRRVPPRRLNQIAVATACGAGGFLVSGLLGVAAGAALGAVLPRVLSQGRAARRRRKARLQVPDALTLIASGLRAGLSERQALEIAARETKDPLGAELMRTSQLVQMGREAIGGLVDLALRLDASDVALGLSTISSQHGVGGNLATLLDQVASDMRDREALRGRLASGTAQGRMTGLVVATVPVGLAFLMNSLAPEYLRPMFVEPVGRLLLGAAAALDVLGLAVIDRLSRVTV